MNESNNSSNVLVICRVDNVDAAPKWAKSHEKLYDCVLSQYGVDVDPCQHFFAGGKWAGICDLLTKQPELLDQYEYFWLPDDDIETTPEDIYYFLNFCKSQNFELAQPALTPHSVYAYSITLANPYFQFRKTNFVELMMPFVKRNLLQRLLPILTNKHAALGVDWVWYTYVSKPGSQVAIVDAVQMGHYRPRNKHLAGIMKEKHNIDILEERQQTFKELKIKPLKPMAHQGILLDGREVEKFHLALKSIFGYYAIRNKIEQRWSWKNYLKLLCCIRR